MCLLFIGASKESHPTQAGSDDQSVPVYISSRNGNGKFTCSQYIYNYIYNIGVGSRCSNW